MKHAQRPACVTSVQSWLKSGKYESIQEKILIRKPGLCIALILSFGATADSEILLRDGSRIRGEILSLENGVYKIESRSLGTIELASSQIQAILSRSSEVDINSFSAPAAGAISAPAAGSLPAAGAQSAMQSIQSALTSDPGMMRSIRELQNDPQMKAIISDPEIMKAIQNFDLQALAENPKIKALMANAKIKRIQQKVQ